MGDVKSIDAFETIVDDHNLAEPLLDLLATDLEPLFWRLVRTGVVSAWYGHVPFAHWIVRAAAPRVLVELGTHHGVSYSAFCEAVALDALDARCFAVDTWCGDEQAGFYAEDVYADFRRFHNSRYGAFSRLLRCSFDEALPYVPAGSIDLLHIDGMHTYEAVRHDYESWFPKLSDRAIVLLHDINVRERNFGVWRLWEELRVRHPAFEFLHSHGLGVLAVGGSPPAKVAALCALRDANKVNAIRQRFALLGERWEAEIRERTLELELVDRNRRIETLESEIRRMEPVHPGPPPGDALAAELAEVEAEAVRLRAELQEVRTAAAQTSVVEAQMRARAAARAAAARTEAAEAIARVAEAERDRHRAAARAEAALRLLALERRRRAPDLESVGNADGSCFDRPGRRWRAATRRSLKSFGARFSARGRRAHQLRRERLSEAKLLLTSPLFDVGWYAAANRKLRGDRLDVALHYLKKGVAAGRSPSREFDAAWYLAHYPDVAKAGLDPLVHYLRQGRAEGREIRPVPEPAVCWGPG